MIRAEQVPDDVWRALQLATGMGETAARGLVAILINKWPGMFINKGNGGVPVRVHLPLTQESGE